MTAPDTIYRANRIYTAADPPWATALATAGDRFLAVGEDEEIRLLATPETEIVDLGDGFVLPGITDAHFHTLMTGDALRRANLVHAKDLSEVQRRIEEWGRDNPGAPWVLGRGWLHSAVPNGKPTRQMLDAVMPDRPVYLEANDYHSGWVNTAGLAALQIDHDTPDPVGGEIVRDAERAPTGELKETAVLKAWDYFASIATAQDRDQLLANALEALAGAGITAVIDMALTPEDLETMERAERAGTLTARIRAHVLLAEDRDIDAQISQAASAAATHSSSWLSVVGVKIISDGVIDSCTAAMLRPFANGAHPPAIWEPAMLGPAVVAADAAGLQIAIHAVGDRAIRNALDAFQQIPADRRAHARHRIEHAELPDPADIPRFGELEIIASMQPVHADPAIRANWTAMLNDERSTRGYPWVALDAVTSLALGTDAPTAPYPPLENLHVAVTRRSALDPSLGAPPREEALALDAALRAMTIGAAWSCKDEGDRGSLEPGKLADFIVLNIDPFASASPELLGGRILRTVVAGSTVFDASGSA